jgi:ATP-dependent RNA helicase DeaD
VESLAQEHDLMSVALAAVKLAHEATAGAERQDDDGDGPPADRDTGRRGHAGATARVYIGAGRAAGIRPQDLVGAIAGESGIPGDQIGTIEIADRFSVVELPEEVVERVIQAMRKTKIKGRKAPVRRFVEK